MTDDDQRLRMVFSAGMLLGHAYRMRDLMERNDLKRAIAANEEVIAEVKRLIWPPQTFDELTRKDG